MSKKGKDELDEKLKNSHSPEQNENANEKAEEEDVIPDLAEMANKVKKEESEKTDYTGYSKSEVKEKIQTDKNFEGWKSDH